MWVTGSKEQVLNFFFGGGGRLTAAAAKLFGDGGGGAGAGAGLDFASISAMTSVSTPLLLLAGAVRVVVSLSTRADSLVFSASRAAILVLMACIVGPLVIQSARVRR